MEPQPETPHSPLGQRKPELPGLSGVKIDGTAAGSLVTTGEGPLPEKAGKPTAELEKECNELQVKWEDLKMKMVDEKTREDTCRGAIYKSLWEFQGRLTEGEKPMNLLAAHLKEHAKSRGTVWYYDGNRDDWYIQL